MTQLRSRFCLSVAALGILSACGGSGGGTNPGGGGTAVIVRDGGTGGPNGATITITSAGLSAASVTVAVGQTVTFVNNDSRSHEIASNPHPQHGSCPSIERGLATLAAGQTRLTQGFAGAGTCGFHDHLNDTNQSLQGSIVIR